MTDGFVAGRVIDQWIDFYNTERPHSALAGRTPAETYLASRPVDMMDKADALPTSPQGLARCFGQVQQQQKALNMRRFWQHDQQPEYTLNPLPTCPTKWDQLNQPGPAHNDRSCQRRPK
jgi:hypothetical protein